jgi:hypothetical protein
VRLGVKRGLIDVLLWFRVTLVASSSLWSHRLIVANRARDMGAQVSGRF